VTERISAAFSTRGIVVGWNGPYGPAWAGLESVRSLEPRWSRHLGAAVSPSAAPPSVAWVSGGPAVVYLQPSGAWARHGELDHLVLPGARIATLGVLGGRPLVAGATDEGLFVLEDEDERIRITERRDVRSLAVVTPGSEAFVVYALSDGILGVYAVGERRDIRHALRGPATDLEALSIGMNAALVLRVEDRLQVAMLAADGSMRERPHTILRRSSLGSAGVAWVQRRFVAAVGDGDRVRVMELDGKGLLDIEVAPGDFALGHVGRVFCAVQVDADARLSLHAHYSDETTASGEVEATPEDAEARSRLIAARDAIEALRTHMAGEGYRDRGVHGRVDPRALRAELHDDVGIVAVQLAVEEEAEVQLVASNDGTLPPMPGSLVRLVGWVRRRLGRDPLADEVAALVGEGVEVAEAWRVADAIVVRLRCASVPSARQLLGWARSLREAL